MNEDQRMAQRLEDHEETRRERDRTDAIIDARHDLITEVKTLRRLELRGRVPLEAHDWWDSLYRLRDITDRLNELEGDTA